MTMPSSRRWAISTQGDTMEHMRDSDLAISTVVGAILVFALLVSVAATVMLVYKPDLKKQAESLHMQNTIDDIFDFKFGIDTMQVASTAGSAYSTSTRIEMGGGEVPVLDPSKSSGMITIDPSYGNLSVTAFYYNDTRVSTRNASSMGHLVYASNNQYYVDQQIEYESGMVILSQQSGKVRLASPPIIVSRDVNDPARPLITVNPIRINGSYQSLGSNDQVSVKTSVIPANNMVRYFNVTNVTINVTSNNADVWHSYFKDLMAQSGLSEGTHYWLTRPDVNKVSLHIMGNGIGDDIGFSMIDSLVLTQIDAAGGPGQPLPPLPIVTPTPVPTSTPTPAPTVGISTKMTATQLSYREGTVANSYIYTVRVVLNVTDLSSTSPAVDVLATMGTITSTPHGQFNGITLVYPPASNPTTIAPLGTATYVWVYDVDVKGNNNVVTFPVTLTGSNITTTLVSHNFPPVEPI